jgi:hypothetical protein
MVEEEEVVRVAGWGGGKFVVRGGEDEKQKAWIDN